MGSLVPFVLGLAITLGLLVPALLRARADSAAARRRADELEKEAADLRRAKTGLEEDLHFLTGFLKDFPRLARELYSGLTERQVPGVLLSIVQRSLEPQQAVVLVRRGDQEQTPRFVVAAANPESAGLRAGTEFPIEQGELGFVAEAQLVVNRQDLSADTALSRIKPGPALPGLKPDLIAPLVFDQDTLGLITVSRPRKTGDAKAALRLVAQTGAQALHTAAQVSRIKITAEMDGLTRVFNKKHINQVLSETIYRAACAAYDHRWAGPGDSAPTLSVLLFDIDHFKHYNDAHGHLAGDRLLQELAFLVQENLRKDDIFGRFGGEEFLVILPQTSVVQALAAAEKIRSVIAAHPFPQADQQPLGRMSVSGGVAEYPHDGLDASGLLRAADEALYEAKRQGRNRILAAARPVSETAPTVRSAQANRP